MERRHRRSLPAVALCCAVLALSGCTPAGDAGSASGIRLEIEGTASVWTDLPTIQAQLHEIGIGVWPLPLGDLPDDLARLLSLPTQSEAETARLRDHFLLPRERLLELIAASGRTPNVPGGGAMETMVANQGYGYPQLWVVQGDVDYARFDRLHVNVADGGVGVDEVLQMISGEGVVVRSEQADGAVYRLQLDCPSADVCWLFCYDAGRSHVGSLSSATPGTKLVVQAIGPPVWSLQYTE
jgi:hypothetical protein